MSLLTFAYVASFALTFTGMVLILLTSTWVVSHVAVAISFVFFLWLTRREPIALIVRVLHGLIAAFLPWMLLTVVIWSCRYATNGNCV